MAKKFNVRDRYGNSIVVEILDVDSDELSPYFGIDDERASEIHDIVTKAMILSSNAVDSMEKILSAISDISEIILAMYFLGRIIERYNTEVQLRNEFIKAMLTMAKSDQLPAIIRLMNLDEDKKTDEGKKSKYNGEKMYI